MEVCIGKVLRTKGLKGEIVVCFFLSQNVCKSGDVLLFEKRYLKYGPYQVEKIYPYRIPAEKHLYVLNLKEVVDIDNSKSLSGCFMLKSFDNLPKNIYLREQLLGIQVVVNKNNNIIGDVVDIIRLKSNYNLLVIKTYKDNIYVPFVKEFVEKIDLQNKKIYIDNLEDAEV